MPYLRKRMVDSAMEETKKKKKKPRDEIVFPVYPEREIPDPPVPNRAHTEMVLGSDGRSGLSDQVNTDKMM